MPVHSITIFTLACLLPLPLAQLPQQKTPFKLAILYNKSIADAHPSFLLKEAILSRMSRPVTQAAERERELARARSQRLKQAVPSLPGESVSRGFADRGALEGYPSHYTSLRQVSVPDLTVL